MFAQPKQFKRVWSWSLHGICQTQKSHSKVHAGIFFLLDSIQLFNSNIIVRYDRIAQIRWSFLSGMGSRFVWRRHQSTMFGEYIGPQRGAWTSETFKKNDIFVKKYWFGSLLLLQVKILFSGKKNINIFTYLDRFIYSLVHYVTLHNWYNLIWTYNTNSFFKWHRQNGNTHQKWNDLAAVFNKWDEIQNWWHWYSRRKQAKRTEITSV